MATLLKAILQQQHLQTYELFKVEFDKAAQRLDSRDRAPSLTQYRRWLAGELKGVPHPRYCRVLVEMFPGYSAADLFGPPIDPSLGNGSTMAGRPAANSPPPNGSPLAGKVIDAHTEAWVDIDEQGHTVVRYLYDAVNLTDRPISRVPRTIWFKYTHAEISVEPVQVGDHEVHIEMQVESTPQKKFAYRISPAIEPGGRARFGSEIRGGVFVDEFFWRHQALRTTKLMTIDVVHRSQTMKRLSATVERTDGSEVLATDEVEWRHDGPDLRLRLQRTGLEPPEVVTLRWETNQS